MAEECFLEEMEASGVSTGELKGSELSPLGFALPQDVQSIWQQPSIRGREKQLHMCQEGNSTEKVLPEDHTGECLITLHPPQYMPVSSSEDEAEKAPPAKGKYTDPTPTPIPRDEPATMDQDEAGREDSPGYSTPPEAVDMTIQQKHTALSNKLDKALQEALEKPSPRASSLKKQGGGDREPTPGPQDLHQGKLNITTERWWLEPNKVRFMDGPDTYRANVGRHREHQPRLMKAKTYPHLVFVDPQLPLTKEKAAAPKGKELQATPQGRPLRPPQTPQQIRKSPVWKCQRHSQCPWNQKW